MKNLKLLVVALVAMFGFIACDKHECNDYDHSADIVGTWTCLQDGYAEALVIKADGSAVSTGYDGTEYWENVAGNIVVENGTITKTFEDGDNFKGHFDIIPGMAFSIYTEEGNRLTFNYCANDLADEVVGMWVCNDGLAEEENDMVIITYSADGKMTMTTPASTFIPTDFVNQVCDYKVVGDLIFKLFPKENFTEGANPYLVSRVTYTPNGTSLGDVLIENQHTPTENGVMELTFTFLRVKQTLDLAGKKYDYIKTFVSNVKGLDKDVEFMGYTFNFAKMDGVKLDKMLKTLLFAVEFPDANTIKYSCHYNNEPMSMEAPIVVDGNKMTVKMSTKNAAYKDVDLYTFQDKDNTQMHMYMPTYAFINFFGNMQATIMSQMGDLDLTDAAAVKAVFDSIDEAVNSINVSFVMTKAAK